MLPDPSPTLTVDGLLLRPLASEDEVAAREADHELHADGVDFLLGHSLLDYEEIRAQFAREARGEVPEGWVPASFYAAIDESGDLVGRVSVRWELNAALRHVNGHVGYAVRPQWRRLGHAARMLRGALALLHAHGVDSALLTCAESNAGSAAVIRACGGVLRDSATTRLDGSSLPEPTLRFDVPTAPVR